MSCIRETHICENWRSNIWHIQGRDWDLVLDIGMELWAITDPIAAIREYPILVICTRSHHDYADGLFQFCNGHIHSAEAEIFANPTRANILASLLAPSVIKAPPNPAFHASSWCYPSAPLTLQISEGDGIDLGDRLLQTLHLTGLSPGSVGLCKANSGLLFTGYALYYGTLCNHLYHSVPETLCESLRRFREIPISTVHTGHYQSFERARMHTVINGNLSGQRSMLCPGPGLA